MDLISAAKWLDEPGAEDMARKLRIPDGMKPDRSEQRRRGLIGVIRQLAEKAAPPTLPTIKGPTMAEIEAKYGK